MEVIQGNLWLCSDCLPAAVNGDLGAMDYYYHKATAEHRKQAVTAGLRRLGGGLVPDFDSETGEGILSFSLVTCGCCGMDLAGERHRFAVLG
jgi:hypothetical protein